MSKLPAAVSALSPLGDAIREPKKAPRKARQKAAPEPLASAWICPCHGTRFDDLQEIYRHIRHELRLRQEARRADGRRLIAMCGTDPGYGAHLRRKEDPCEECRAAHRDKMAKYAADPVTRERIRARHKARSAARTDEERAQRNADQKLRYAAKKAQK